MPFNLRLPWACFIYFTLQVVNFVVRKEIHHVARFVALEAVYIVAEFALYGILLGVLYAKHGNNSNDKTA